MAKEYLTAEQIVDIAESRSNTRLGIRRIINKLFREQDDSELYPILGKFNAIERAIRRARKFERLSDVMSPLEYAYFLEAEMSRIVNQES